MTSSINVSTVVIDPYSTLRRAAVGACALILGALTGCATPEATYQPAPYSTTVWTGPLEAFTPLSVRDNSGYQHQLKTQRLAIVTQTERSKRHSETAITAEDLAARFNATLPRDNALMSQHFDVALDDVDLHQPMLKNMQAKERSWREVLRFASGGSPSSTSAIVVFGDWTELPKLPSADTDGTCIYYVGMGNRFALFRPVGSATCGFVTASNRLASPEQMAHFVRQVLYEPPTDQDGDGIYDHRDACPDTPADRRVDSTGCLLFGQTLNAEETSHAP